MGLLINPYRFAAPAVTLAAYAASLGPVGWWRLGESSGTAAVAQAGPNGTYVGTPTLGVAGLVSGDADTAVTLAASQYVDIPDNAAWDFSSCTFVAVVKTSAAALRSIISRDGASGSRSWQFRMTATGKLETIILSAAGTTRSLVSAGSINDNAAHVVIGTYDNSTGLITCYIDGLRHGTSSGTPITLSLTLANVINVGRFPAGGTGTALGTVDEPMIFNRAITQAEAEQLSVVILGTVPWSATGLPAYAQDVYSVDRPLLHLQLGETSGLTLNDISDYNRDVTLTGSAGSGYNAASLLDQGADGAMVFDGTFHGSRAGDGLFPEIMTCAAWVKTTSTALGRIASCDSSGTAKSWLFSVDATGVPIMQGYNSTVGVPISGTIPVNDGLRHLVVGVRDTVNDRIKIYVDGALDVDSAATMDLGQGAPTFQLGAARGIDRFVGTIDELSVFDYEPSATRVAAWWAAGT